MLASGILSSIGNGTTKTLCKNGLPTQKNTLAGLTLQKCIFSPLRATSVSSSLVSNFRVYHPSRNQKNYLTGPQLETRIFHIFSKNSLPTPPEIKKWLTISKSWLFIFSYFFTTSLQKSKFASPFAQYQEP